VYLGQHLGHQVERRALNAQRAPGSAQSLAQHPRAPFVKQFAQLVVGHPREKVAPCGGVGFGTCPRTSSRGMT
jgi:hypothetical protein